MREIQVEYDLISNNIYNQMIASLSSLLINDIEERDLSMSLEVVNKNNQLDKRVHWIWKIEKQLKSNQKEFLFLSD